MQVPESGSPGSPDRLARIAVRRDPGPTQLSLPPPHRAIPLDGKGIQQILRTVQFHLGAAHVPADTAGVRSHIAIGLLRCALTVQVFAVAPSAAVTVTAIDCVCPGATATWRPLPASAGVIAAVAPVERGTAATVTYPAPAGNAAL